MNTAKLKKYAPQARREFISAVSKQLNQLGIYSDKQISDVKEQGSVLSIEGKAFPIGIKTARERLVRKVKTFGYAQLIEQVAYTWFNRLCAIRYMEIHDYLGHGFRVLSHPDNPKGFEIIDHAQDAADELGLDRARIIELKLAGNKDEELYRELLLGQCHKLHEAMPFLFDALDDETELLLPDNLTRTDSILRGLVDSIPEEDWQQVEVIGWLYQFYISEKKDQVMGKVVKSEDIPAATQLFTPNWIVKYLVQNSVGRQWLQTYPDSAIKTQMEYYIEPAEQSDEVNQQLKAITPESIEPETIKVLDPACGSGHILIEAYNVLKAIYEERGFRSRDIPKMILENNLYGLDIDDRAAQLSGFALMMMARDDDKRIFTRNVRLNVLSLQESNHIDLPTLWKALNLSGSWQSGTSQGLFSDDEQDLSSFNADNRYQLLKRTLARFTQAKTFGSLIDVPSDEHEQLKELLNTLVELQESGDSMQKPAAKQLIEIVHQALVLSIRYDAVIANPPYMGAQSMNTELKKFAQSKFPLSKSDMFSLFMERSFDLIKSEGSNAQVNMHSWMFISSYEGLRESVLSKRTIRSLIHLGPRAFSQISGEVVQTCAWIISNTNIPGYLTKFHRLVDGVEESKRLSLLASENVYENIKQDEFFRLPMSPIAYWVNESTLSMFGHHTIGDDFEVKAGISTGKNDSCIFYWWEVYKSKIGESKSDSYYLLHNKGGELRKWYGNIDSILKYGPKNISRMETYSGFRHDGKDYYGREMIGWSKISSTRSSFRYYPVGMSFDSAGLALFNQSTDSLLDVLAWLNSDICADIIPMLNPTLNVTPKIIKSLPFKELKPTSRVVVDELVRIHKKDWDSHECSFDFEFNHLIQQNGLKVCDATERLVEVASSLVDKVLKLEEENNRNVRESYLGDYSNYSEDTSHVTLNCNMSYKYGDVEDSKSRYVSDIVVELFSYSIGCMMGRFSLVKPGFMLGNEIYELNSENYGGFIPDEDAIIPLTDNEWFKDDTTNRFREFVQVVWGEQYLQENLDFVAESLCLNAIKPKKSESALETIRRYLSTQFYKDHLKTYKKRPIYWLFSSGKQKAFECLVYLHRYNEGTLSRMRTEYVTPLLGKYDAYAEQLEKQIETADSTSEANRFKKELDALIKKQVELREFDDKLKHYADMRISLDLDDGVKVNYGKFGDLLADVKAITGSAPEVN